MKRKNDFRSGLIGVLKNRFVLTGIFGLVWVSFVSEIDLIYLIKSQQELNELKTQVDHYDQKISETGEQLRALSSEPALLERFAREQYFMKRDNEDLFRIVASVADQPMK
jgi:cell division protein DivIC